MELTISLEVLDLDEENLVELSTAFSTEQLLVSKASLTQQEDGPILDMKTCSSWLFDRK